MTAVWPAPGFAAELLAASSRRAGRMELLEGALEHLLETTQEQEGIDTRSWSRETVWVQVRINDHELATFRNDAAYFGHAIVKPMLHALAAKLEHMGATPLHMIRGWALPQPVVDRSYVVAVTHTGARS